MPTEDLTLEQIAKRDTYLSQERFNDPASLRELAEILMGRANELDPPAKPVEAVSYKAAVMAEVQLDSVRKDLLTVKQGLTSIPVLYLDEENGSIIGQIRNLEQRVGICQNRAAEDRRQIEQQIGLYKGALLVPATR